ncbi:hypothetical protein [Vibrio nigripulchritudo]|uniref:hypothetical protein n=1 Tax=Vibrio nigripulchritudo TaxID=28173 RepID=UPI0005F9D6A0|nr:hypothetical protein [Vibrio nigripulchritudo]KJY66484.1 hypothetical protein TW74_27850 [Vibrio nigripulchritudo]
MNKLVIAAGIVAVGAGGYFYTQQQASQSVSILDQIPADSAIVGVPLKPVQLDKFLGSVDTFPTIDEFMELSQTDPERMTNRETFFYALAETYIKSIESAEAYKAAFGAPDMINSYIYMVGIAPVMKFDVENEQAFWATFDKAESSSNFKHTAKKIGDVSYRSYSIADEDGQTKLELVVAVHQGMATLTLDSADFGELSPLKIALGIEAPTQSIAQAETIKQLIAKHPNLSDESVGYFDHQQLVTGFTTTDGNLLAKHVAKISELVKADDPSAINPFAEIQTEQCKTEFASIAANWPRTVFGATVNDGGLTMDAKFVVESNNKVILDALKTIRGFIPSSAQDSALSFGLGIDVNNLTPALNAIWQDSLSVQYSCAPLAEMQAGLSQANPAMVGMATGFVNGLKGISFNLFDYGFGETEYGEELNKLDASVSISADNPVALFQAAQMMEPSLAQVQIPADGTPVELPPQLAAQFADIGTVYVASKGSHLTIYTGETATKESTKLFDQTLEANGLYSIYFDYGKLFKPFVDMVERSGEPVPAELEPFIQDDVKGDVKMDVTDKGIVFEMNNVTY